MHILKIKAAHGGKAHGTNNLVSFGGSIEQSAKLYIVYWGAEWQTGFTTGGYTSAQAQSYIEGFFNGVGGSSWANSTTQYCQGVPVGTVQCGTAVVHPSNPANELAGTWNDTSTVPTSPAQFDISNEARALAAHFGGVNNQADYMVLTPTGHSMNGFATSWCAWHSSSGSMSYSYIPYQPDAAGSCGMNFVNPSNNAFGNGYFDGFSIVGGHEYAETITDPYPDTGWLDRFAAENGDKCAWISSAREPPRTSAWAARVTPFSRCGATPSTTEAEAASTRTRTPAPHPSLKTCPRTRRRRASSASRARLPSRLHRR